MLPIKAKEIKSNEPNSLILVSDPKCGKSTILAQLPDSLIISTEPKGYDFLSANYVEALNHKDFKAITKELLEIKPFPYKFVCIDTMTSLDEWSEDVGTINYMKSTQGKRFNRTEDGIPITRSDVNWQTVHDLANGSGYKWSRSVMTEWIDTYLFLPCHIIFVAHSNSIMIGESELKEKTLLVTGKLRTIIPSRVDGVGFMYREKDTNYLSFDPNQLNLAYGCRFDLGNRVEISKKINNKITTKWENIFPSITKHNN